MSVSTETSSVDYAGNGVTVAFATGFKFFEDGDLVVSLTVGVATPLVLTLGVHYTVTGEGLEAGGTVTMVTAPAVGETLTIEREVPFTQETSFRSQGTFSPAVHEDALDALCMQIQQLDRRTATVEAQSELGDTVIGNGLYMDADTLHLGVGVGLTLGADDVAVSFGTTPANVTKAAASAGVSALVPRLDHKHDISTAAPAAGGVVIGGAATEGTATTLARSDHIHAVSAAAPAAGAVAIGNAAAAGAAATFSRSDHVHAVTAPAAPADVTKAAASAGAATTFARADHKHDITTAAAASVGTANAEGAATSLSRSDHVHNHGDQAIGAGTQHAVATTLLAGFMSAADKLKLDNQPSTFTGTVQTTSATPDVVASRTVEDGKCEVLEVAISAMRSTLAEAAGYVIVGTFRRTGGAVTQVGTTTALVTNEDAAGWAVAFVVVGTAVQVQVTGAAGSTVDWRARGRFTTAP